MADQAAIELGGSSAAISHHYDVGNDFYREWLDPTMTYSCAMWDGLPDDAPLEAAQQRKLDFHAQAIKAGPGMRVLDVGCGWGAMMEALLSRYAVDACVGLTLSAEQHGYIAEQQMRGMQSSLVNWKDFETPVPFDGVISIGAFEHFAHPRQNVEERRAVYRDFFESCLRWTAGRGRLSLQTIAYADMAPEEASPFITNDIFRDAELPTLEDIVTASKGLMRIVCVRDDGLDYARTCEAWSRRLRQAVRAGRVYATTAPVERYSRYLRMSAAGFRMRKISLLRIAFEPSRSRQATANLTP